MPSASSFCSDESAVSSRNWWRTPLEFWLLAWLGLAITLQPIADEDFWWHLSRGRTVLEGSLTPSADLLTAESGREADWLGGVPLFLIYSVAGAGGLMLMKVAVLAGILWWFWHRAPTVSRVGRMLIIASGLVAARSAWDATPRFVDALGPVLMWCLAGTWFRRPTPGRLGAILAIQGVWANTASLSLLGIVAGSLACMAAPPPETRLPGGRRPVLPYGLLLMTIATPRGFWTLWDSLRLLFPGLAAPGWALAETDWRPLGTGGAVSLQELSFLALSLLSGLCVGHVFLTVKGRQSVACGVAWLLAVLLAITSRSNLPACALWIMLLTLDGLTKRTSPVPRQSGSDFPTWPSKILRHRAARWLVMGAVAVCGVGEAGGWWPGAEQRLGWGRDSKLAVELLELPLAELDLRGSAHVWGIRAAGALAWQNHPHLKVDDTPQRALLGGRLADNVLLNSDLEQGHQHSYWRTDGSRGGWWLELAARRTVLLLVPTEQTVAIRTLEPTLWKPLSLDAVDLPYGLASNRVCAPRILEIVRQREFVNRGPWTYQAPAVTGTLLYGDFWGWLTGSRNLEAELRQADVCRAMTLPVAALRVLASETDAPAPSRVGEIVVHCQMDLADTERTEMGYVSPFRQQAVEAFAARWEVTLWPAARRRLQEAEPAMREPASSDSPAFLAPYVAGDFPAAVAAVDGNSAETLYTRGWLELEAANSRAAAVQFRRLVSDYPHSPLTIVGQDVLDSLSY